MSLFVHHYHGLRGPVESGSAPPTGPSNPIVYEQAVGTATANGSASTTIAWSGSVSVGNNADSLLWVGVLRYETAGTVTVTDNLSNTYVEAEATTEAAAFCNGFYAYTGSGTLTSVTATIPNSRYRGIVIAEFSNVGDFVEAGGASSGTATPQTWVNAKNIPAYGAALGVTVSNTNNMTGAGGASGTPSVTPTAHIIANPDRGLMVLSGIAGGTAVVSFTGQSVVGAGSFGNAGAIFEAAS